MEHGVRDRLVVSFLYTVFMITTFFSLTLQCLNLGIPKPPANFTWIYLPKLLRNLPAKKYQITWSLPLNYLHPSSTSKSQPFFQKLSPFVFMPVCPWNWSSSKANTILFKCDTGIACFNLQNKHWNHKNTQPSFWYKLLLSNQGKDIF